MTIPNIRTLDRTSASFKSDVDAVFNGELNTTIAAWNADIAAADAMFAGTAYAIPYTISSTITDADPGNGFLRFSDFAAQTSATTLRLDLVDAGGATQTAIIDTFDDSTSVIKGQFRLVKRGNAAVWLAGEITAVATPAGYRNLTVQGLTGSSAAPFANADSVVMLFTRTGDKGAAGTSSPLVRSARTSNTILASADNGRLIDFTSGTFTQTLTTSTTLGGGWYAYLKNSGTGDITLDPNGAETIDGFLTRVLRPGEARLVQCDGTAFNTVLITQPAEFVPTLVAAAASMTLPSLTNMPGPPLVTAPTNAAAVPANLTTSNGWSISTGFVAGTLSSIAATHKESAHGAWGTRSMLPPQIGTTVTNSAVLVVVGSVQLDTTVYVVMCRDATNYYAFVVSGSSVGSLTTLGTYHVTGDGFEAIYKVSTTSFICQFRNGGGGTSVVVAGSISGTTITLGTGVSPGAPIQRMIQLSATTYVCANDSATLNIIAITVSGTTLTLGAGSTAGSTAGGVGYLQLLPVTATTCLAVYLATGGGSATTRLFSARVVTVSTVDASTTLAAAVTAGGNTQNNAGIRLARAFAVGGPYVVAVQAGSPTTTGNYFGITVSGTTPTIGSALPRTDDLPLANNGPATLVYPIAEPAFLFNATTILLGHLAAGPYVMTISGTTLTGGSATTLSGASTKVFLRDLNTETNLYAVGGGIYDKITVSGTTISSTDSFTGGAPTLIYSDSLNDKAAKYGSTWYAWTLSVLGGLTTTTLLFRNGTNNISINGPLS